jgi:hypothetical protein
MDVYWLVGEVVLLLLLLLEREEGGDGRDSALLFH